MNYVKKTGEILLTLLSACALIIGAGLLILKLTGCHVLAVQTGSMGDSYPVGSLVIVAAPQPDEIGEGDVISFVADGSLAVVTHRVVSVDTQNRCFYTKGDSNDTADTEPVLYENLLGKVIFSFPYAGYAVLFVQGRIGKILLWAVIAGIAVYFSEQLFVSVQKRRKERHDEQSDRDKQE